MRSSVEDAFKRLARQWLRPRTDASCSLAALSSKLKISGAGSPSPAELGDEP
eukprot:CAMPEP_0177259118 /NCGR_PEP_ID=MMETSP0367-20130122/58471_1 /TAXON_ID=447022 ORGANISM="Scrippsiella hangoei-like, Strain SHHI-4" /NCGR_SAMPLE_ID=MMETSP0367 /ASSEMBLY_ACC=CAM_ASM_000362 /LENGTH=51 /DNA_ID=CAMNT_0018713381 /DNA_START=295 /DNA_END=447 /DNA_ORIENTATION=-